MRLAIDKIRAAEAEAAEMKKQAQLAADEAQIQAKADGKKAIEAAIEKANKDAEKIVAEAEAKASEAAGGKVDIARKEADAILEKAESRMDQAAQKIVERIVDSI